MATQFVTRSLNLDVKGMAGRAVKELLIKVARETHEEEKRRGFDPDPVRIVDGKYGGQIAAVKPFGRIILAERVSLVDATTWILAELNKRAATFRKTGRYMGAFTVLVDGTQVGEGGIEAALKPGSRVQIVAAIVYARRVEAHHKVFQAVHILAKRRFGRSMFVDFRLVPLNLGETVMGAAGGRSKGVRHSRKRERKARAQIYPTIQLYRAASVGTTVH